MGGVVKFEELNICLLYTSGIIQNQRSSEPQDDDYDDRTEKFTHRMGQ